MRGALVAFAARPVCAGGDDTAGLPPIDARKRKPWGAMACSVLEHESLLAAVKRPGFPPTAQAAVMQLVGACEEPECAPLFSSLEAIGLAALRVASGEVEMAVCGGAAAPLTVKILEELKTLGLSPRHVKEAERL